MWCRCVSHLLAIWSFSGRLQHRAHRKAQRDRQVVLVYTLLAAYQGDGLALPHDDVGLVAPRIVNR